MDYGVKKLKKDKKKIHNFSLFNTCRSRDGYIALVAAFVISAAMVFVILAVGQSSFFNRAAISEVHFKEKSRALAEACADTALLKLVGNSSYAGNETINVASDTCKIFAIVSSSTGRIVDVQGIFKSSYTNFRVTVTTSVVDIIRWEEIKRL